MTAPSRIVIVGASIGGLTAAETLRHEGFEGEIVLVGDEAHLPYNRPPLSKQILVGDWEADGAAIRSRGELDELGIQLRSSCTATALDVAGRVLHTSTGDISFDELIIATGTRPRSHPLVPSALTMRTTDDALAIRDGLRTARRVIVIGPGILGSELASAARKYGADTLLLGRSGELTFGSVGALLTDQLAQLHEQHGVELSLRSEIVGASAHGGETSIQFADGRSERGDLVVAMIGGTPQTQWLASSTLTVADGVVCDETGRAAPGIHAVGDVAAWRDPRTGTQVRVEHQSNAIEQAIAVATHIVHSQPGERPVPLFWSEIHQTRITAYGWFDPQRALVPFADSPVHDPRVLVSRDDTDRVMGAVGWNAPPRDFRMARAAVSAAAATAPTLA